MKLKHVTFLIASLIISQSLFLFTGSAKCQYTEDEFRKEIYNDFVNLENKLFEIDEQIVFMSNNKIYDIDKFNEFTKLLQDQKNNYIGIMNEINSNELMDSDYMKISELYREELNETISKLSTFRKQLVDNDKSQRGKQLIEALEELFK